MSITHPSSGLVVQPRDIEMLSAVFTYRFLRSEHLQALLFSGVSRRTVQTRLKKLSEHRYLKRWYVPSMLDGEHQALTHPRQPIYSLGSRGHQLLQASDTSIRADLDRWRPEMVSVTTLAHHLVVTECLIALAVQCRADPRVQLLHAEHEGVLWSKLRTYRREKRITHALVPDGAFTLHYPESHETLTFYLEVVRADVKGGNRRLIEKLRRYIELHRSGFFREVYGHDRLRAVLFATTSKARAQNLVRVAEKLTHGRGLFWFGSYQEKTAAGRFSSLYTPDRILTLPWVTPDGEHSLLQPHSAPPETGAT
jgi:hypothetical protein